MQTPIKIDFQGFTPNDRQRAAVQEHVELFENRFGLITSGHIVVIGPGGHHRTGDPYEIHVQLRLPAAKEVHISHTPGIDERHSDFFFALNDAFKRARRQLGNKASRLQGETKHHEPQITGIVTKLFEDHGFVESENGLEIYFHKNSVLGEGFSKLKPGISVTFVEELGENGPQASTIKL